MAECYTEGLKTGFPLAANTLLAEYVNGLGYTVAPVPLIVMGSSVLAVIEMQRRNAANTADVWTHRFWLDAAHPSVMLGPENGFALDSGERLRLFLVASLFGSVQGSLFI